MKYKEYSFKELLSNIVDNRGRTCPTAEEGIPLIATNCIRNEQLYPSYEKIRHISQDTYDTWFRDHPKPDDMIFVCKGSPGRVCWVPNPINFCIAQDMVAIRADETKVYPKYLFALLRSSETQHQIENMHVGTLIPHFKKGDFGNLFLHIPEDYEYQRKVGDIYFQFCKKIELNRQINQSLEAMAQAIFKSWFVDFEPVKAKISAIEAGEDAEGITRAAMSAISGKTNEELEQLQAEQPEHYMQLKTTAELFPTAMQDSDLGFIPKGWRVGDLGEFASISSGKRPKQKSDCKNKEFNVPLIGASSIMGYVNEILYKKPILVIGRVGTHGIIQRTFQPSYPSDNTLVIRSKYHEYVYQILDSIDYVSLNVGSTQPLITQTSIKHSKIIIPNESLLDRFEKISASMFSNINSNNTENQNLCDLRDSLLPKLLSGELSVDAAELVEE